MPKPTMLEMAIKEWGVLRDELLDTYCAVAGEDSSRYYSPEFIYLVRSETNLDLIRMTPADPDSLDSVLRERECLYELIDAVKDEKSEFMKKYRNSPQNSFDPAVLRQIQRKIPSSVDF